MTHSFPSLMAVYNSGSEKLNTAAFSPDGTRLVTASNDKTARIWNTSTGQRQLQLSHKNSVECAAFSPDGTRLATGSADGSARIWDASSGERQLQLSHDHAVSKLVFSPDGTRLATREDYSGTVRTWDAANGQSCKLPSPVMGQRSAQMAAVSP